MKKILLFMALLLLLTTGTVAAQNHTPLLGEKTETGDSFEIQGTITSVNDSSFIVRGELVAVSGEDMDRFKSNKLLDVGNFVQVKGEIKNNIMMAKDVSVLGKNPEAESSGLTTQTSVQTTNTSSDGNIIKDLVTAIKDLLE